MMCPTSIVHVEAIVLRTVERIVVILSVEIDVAEAGNFDGDTFAMLVDKTIEEQVVEDAG